MKIFSKRKAISNQDVDLSNDRIFDKNLRGIKSLSQKEYYSMTGAVFTGTVKDIKQHHFINSFADGRTCDCCGSTIPPLYFDTLCPKCNERMNKDYFYNKIFDSDKHKQKKLDKVWFVEQKI